MTAATANPATNPAGNRHGSATIELVGDAELIITRAFDAPAALVYRAVTTPELVTRWWGLETSEWLVCDIDARVGGRWRYVTRETTPDGAFEVGFHGEYLELDAPQRIVTTEVFEGFPGQPFTDEDGAVNTFSLEEADGVTTMRVHVRHAKPEHRDAHLASGMERGMQVSYDRLEDLVRAGA